VSNGPVGIRIAVLRRRLGSLRRRQIAVSVFGLGCTVLATRAVGSGGRRSRSLVRRLCVIVATILVLSSSLIFDFFVSIIVYWGGCSGHSRASIGVGRRRGLVLVLVLHRAGCCVGANGPLLI